jgi:hypothetical protein
MIWFKTENETQTFKKIKATLLTQFCCIYHFLQSLRVQMLIISNRAKSIYFTLSLTFHLPLEYILAHIHTSTLNKKDIPPLISLSFFTYINSFHFSNQKGKRTRTKMKGWINIPSTHWSFQETWERGLAHLILHKF